MPSKTAQIYRSRSQYVSLKIIYLIISAYIGAAEDAPSFCALRPLVQVLKLPDEEWSCDAGFDGNANRNVLCCQYPNLTPRNLKNAPTNELKDNGKAIHTEEGKAAVSATPPKTKVSLVMPDTLNPLKPKEAKAHIPLDAHLGRRFLKGRG